MLDDDDDGTKQNLPAPNSYNNWDTDGGITGERLKCVDGVWTNQDGIEVSGKKLLAIGTITYLQRWRDDGKPPKKIFKQDGKLPHPDDLNDAIPKSEWRTNPNDGKPEPPWKQAWEVHLIDEATGKAYTFSNTTTGAMRAFNELAGQVMIKQKMAGKNNLLLPIVELSRKVMPTEHGRKLRPHFEVLNWHQLGNPELQPQPANPQLTVERPSAEKDLDDSIPF